MRRLNKSSKIDTSWSVSMTLESSPPSTPVEPGADAGKKWDSEMLPAFQVLCSTHWCAARHGKNSSLTRACEIAPDWGRIGFGHLLGGLTDQWDDVEVDFSYMGDILRGWSTSNAGVRKQFFPGFFCFPLQYQTWPLVRLLQPLFAGLLPAAHVLWR